MGRQLLVDKEYLKGTEHLMGNQCSRCQEEGNYTKALLLDMERKVPVEVGKHHLGYIEEVLLWEL